MSSLGLRRQFRLPWAISSSSSASAARCFRLSTWRSSRSEGLDIRNLDCLSCNLDEGYYSSTSTSCPSPRERFRSGRNAWVLTFTYWSALVALTICKGNRSCCQCFSPVPHDVGLCSFMQASKYLDPPAAAHETTRSSSPVFDMFESKGRSRH